MQWLWMPRLENYFEIILFEPNIAAFAFREQKIKVYKAEQRNFRLVWFEEWIEPILLLSSSFLSSRWIIESISSVLTGSSSDLCDNVVCSVYLHYTPCCSWTVLYWSHTRGLQQRRWHRQCFWKCIIDSISCLKYVSKEIFLSVSQFRSVSGDLCDYWQLSSLLLQWIMSPLRVKTS